VADYKAANDPLEPTNRVIYEVNDGLDAVILKPLALAYRNIVPAPAQTGVRNVITRGGSRPTLPPALQ
jgi:phospholipid-binding lipoprotein MlaA